MKASDLHIHLVLAILAYIRLAIFVAGIPLTVTSGSLALVDVADSESQSALDEALAPFFSSFNASYSALNLFYEIEVEGKGYVGTGHVDFNAIVSAES